MRKEERILNALTDVKEEYIGAVEWEEEPRKTTGKNASKRWAKWIGLAASLVILLFLAFHIPRALVTPNPPDTENFATEKDEDELDVEGEKDPNGEDLQVITAACDLGTMGSGQVSEEEINTDNPWKDTREITALPVYKNLAYYSPAGEPVYLSRETLLTMAEGVAEKLGTEVSTWVYMEVMKTLEKGDVDVYQITTTTELAEIQVSGNGHIYVAFHEPVSWSTKDKLLDEVNSDSEIDELLEYFFNNAYFYGDEEQGLKRIHYGDVRIAAENLGNYPIISTEEAKQRLMAGRYISIILESEVKGGAFSNEDIESVELVYLTSSTCQYYQPYYCFYMKLEEEERGYGMFYVPALETLYLSDLENLNPLGN